MFTRTIGVLFVIALLYAVAQFIGGVFTGWKPSISFFILAPVALASMAFLIYMVAKANGKDLFARNPDGSLGKTGQTLKDIATSPAFYATLAAIIFAMVVELVAPAFYAKWWGGENGWALFVAAMLAVPLGTYLSHKESDGLKNAGKTIAVVGFFGPLLLATSIGNKASQQFDKITEGNFLTVTTERWSEVYKLAPGEKLTYNRVDQGACILVRHGGDDKLVKLIGRCEPPEEYKAAKGAEIPKDAVTRGLEFRAIGKPTKLELIRS